MRHINFLGAKNGGFWVGGQKVYVEKFMCFFRPLFSYANFLTSGKWAKQRPTNGGFRVSGLPCWKAAFFLPFAGFLALFQRAAHCIAPGKSWECMKKAFSLKYPWSCLSCRLCALRFGGSQKGGFGGCFPVPKTEKKVHSDVPRYQKPERGYYLHGNDYKWSCRFYFALAFVMETQTNSPRFSFAFAFVIIMLGTHKPQQQATLTKLIKIPEIFFWFRFRKSTQRKA